MSTSVRIDLEKPDCRATEEVWRTEDHRVTYICPENVEEWADLLDEAYGRVTDDEDESEWFIPSTKANPAYADLIETVGDKARTLPAPPTGWEHADVTITILW